MNVCPCLPHKTFQHSIINVTVDSEGCLDSWAMQPYSPLILKEEETIMHSTSSSTKLRVTLPEELPSVEDALKKLNAGINDFRHNRA